MESLKFPTNLTHFCHLFIETNWVVSENGANCNDVCARSGRTCNAAEQSKLTTKELMEDAMVKAGQPCTVTKNRGYAGSPFFRPKAGDCFFLTPGSTSICDDNLHIFHDPLCYCECK